MERPGTKGRCCKGYFDHGGASCRESKHQQVGDAEPVLPKTYAGVWISIILISTYAAAALIDDVLLQSVRLAQTHPESWTANITEP